jgi:hypothetical protein
MPTTPTKRISIRNCTFLVAAILLLSVVSARAESAATNDWPREIQTKRGRVLVYQPQLESLEGDTLTGRAAISFTPTGGQAAFGAFWFEAKIRTDRDSRTYTLDKVKVPNVKFPELDAEKAEIEARFLEREIPKWNVDGSLDGSLDTILPALELAKKEKAAVGQLKVDPPKILFRTTPSVLLLYDGKPRTRPVEGSNLRRAENTPFFVVQASSGAWYLGLGDLWYGAADPVGPWKAGANPPASIRNLHAKEAASAREKGARPGSEENDSHPPGVGKSPVPEIIVATEPAELIQTDGEPKYASLPGNELLYIENTASDVLLPIGTQKHFALLSGRWFETPSLIGGKWDFVPPDKLPPEFRKIPADSPMGHVRASVAGTDEAKEAVLDTYVPQTSAIKREKNAKVAVRYDGEPKFEPIQGIPLSYAVNTGSSVLRHEDRFYLCEQAVWYVSASPKGPWEVATSIPAEIQAIPPEYPVYNVKYVYIYESTPTVVYVGYTPGYLWAYPYYGTVVYGTGYYYSGWYGPAYYYPRPVTYGYHAAYDPYTGSWGFGVGVFTPGFSFTFWGPPSHGWWGPGGYRPPYYGGYYPPGRYPPGRYPPGYRPPPGSRPPAGGHRPVPTPYGGGRPATRDNIYARPGNVDRVPPGFRPSTRPAPGVGPSTRPAPGVGPSTRPAPGVGPSTRPAPGGNAGAAPRPATRENNVYADPGGNVHRKTPDGWEQRGQGGWNREGGPRPQTGAIPSMGGGGRAPSTLDRDFQTRTRGAERSRNFNNYRAPGGGWGGGGGRGGGGGGGRRR